MTSHQTIAETKSSSSLELLMVVSTTETSKSRRTQELLKRQTIISSILVYIRETQENASHWCRACQMTWIVRRLKEPSRRPGAAMEQQLSTKIGEQSFSSKEITDATFLSSSLRKVFASRTRSKSMVTDRVVKMTLQILMQKWH